MFAGLYFYGMNKAQTAIYNKMTDIISQCDKPLSSIEEGILIEILQAVKPTTFLGLCIKKHFDEGGENSLLIGTLAAQAMDDPFVISCTVGRDAMILLLRSAL